MPPPPRPDTPAPPPRRGRRLALCLVLLLAAGGAGWGLWARHRWRRAAARLARAEEAFAAYRLHPARTDRLRDAREALDGLAETPGGGQAAAVRERLAVLLAPRTFTVENVTGLRNSTRRRTGRRSPEDAFRWQVEARPGELLALETWGRVLRQPVTPGTPATLRLETDGWRYLLNGRLVGLELEGEGARQWLVRARPAALKDLSYICTGLFAPAERPALAKVTHPWLVIDVNEEHYAAIDPALPGLNPRTLIINSSLPAGGMGRVAGLGNLRHLELNGPLSESDREQLARMENLEHLVLGVGTDPPDLQPVGRLADLVTLEVWEAQEVPSLVPLQRLTRLERLVLLDGQAVSSLDPLAGLPRLRSLSLTALTEASRLGQLPSGEEAARRLGLDTAPRRHVDGLAALGGLRRLSLYGAGGVGELGALERLPALETLELYGGIFVSGRGLTETPPLAELTALRRLVLAGGTMTDLRFLRRQRELRELLLFRPGQLSTLQGAAHLPRLTDLRIEAGHEGLSLAGLEYLEGLERFALGARRGLPELAPLLGLRELRHLELRAGLRAEQLAEIARALPELRTLRLLEADLDDLAVLAPLQKLQVLDLSFCPSLQSLDGLEKLPALRALEVQACYALADLSALAECPALESVRLQSCDQVRDLGPLAPLRGLKQVDLSGCDAVADLAPLGSLPRLEVLNLERCRGVRDITPLGRARKLVSLQLSLTAVTDLTPLAGHPSLTWLWIHGLEIDTAQLRRLPACRIAGP